MTAINICVCTCHRGERLRTCLDSLAKIRQIDGASLSVSIVDNDVERSAESIVDSYRGNFPFELYYFCEARRGIPCARNRAIEETIRLGSDYLVFVDDDEWVEPEWLNMLYGFCQQNGGNVVVSGGVVAELPKDTPEDMVGLFNTRAQGTLGQRLETCATNNVLVPMPFIVDQALRFDESKPFAGGTDTIFFKKATQKGMVILRCPQALVHELIPASRTSLEWWLKRKFRVGITEAQRKRLGGRSSLSIFLSAAFQMLVEMVKVAVLYLFGQKLLFNRSILKTYRCAGIISGVFGFKVDSYRVVESKESGGS